MICRFAALTFWDTRTKVVQITRRFVTKMLFARFEWLIAWRYLRARRAEGGISVMTWISLIGIALAVFALIATLAVRSGFRHEFVDTIIGANPHLTVTPAERMGRTGQMRAGFTQADLLAARFAEVPGVLRAAPVITGEVMAVGRAQNTGVQVTGIRSADLWAIPRMAQPEVALGDPDRFDQGISIGTGVARALGVSVGDTIRLISPDGARTAFGTSPRVKAYEVVYIFQVGRWDIDRVRVFLPLQEAATFFNRADLADEIHISVTTPEQIEAFDLPILRAAGDMPVLLWSWKDSSGAFLQALQMEDNVMFVILSILVLIATMNITSGLIMLVKNKGRDIGILRTMGLSEGSILRIFFLCGASIGVAGTVIGVVAGCAFALYIDPIFAFVNYVAGGGVWDPSVRYLSRLPARLEAGDVLSAVSLSLFLSFVVTWFPARRAARMNPVEALRYE